jgi:Ca2+-binding RTX toxin-like protein
MASNNEEADIDEAVPSGNPLIDGLLLEYYWSQSARLNFQFTIPDSEEDYEATRDGLVSDYPDDSHEHIVPWSPFMLGGIRKAVAEYLNILPFAITEQGDNDVDTQLRFGLADLSHERPDDTPPAYAYAPQDDGIGTEQANWRSGDMFYGLPAFGSIPQRNIAPAGQPAQMVNFAEIVGTYQYHTFLHETGHALGLKHGHEAEDGFPQLPSDRDSMEFTVMTYRGYVGDDPDRAVDGTAQQGYEVATGQYAQTLMMLDILALQYLYGADYTTRSGDTTYKWTFEGEYSIREGALGTFSRQWKTDTGTIFLTIWDGGGNDTYDFSEFGANQVIDLGPGYWSNLGTNLAQLAPGYTPPGGAPVPAQIARGNVFNAMLWGGDERSLIENVRAGTGNDRLTGNQVGNRLEGGLGNDTLFGFGGDDTLAGGFGNRSATLPGDGADELYGGDGFDIAEYADPNGEYVIIKPIPGGPVLRWSVRGFNPAPVDDLTNIEAFRFGEGGDEVLGDSTSPGIGFNLDGRGGDDRITAGAGADTLVGGLGTDLLRPGEGVFRVFGGAPNAGSVDGWAESAAQNDHLELDRRADPDGYRLNFATGSSYAVGHFTSSGTGGDGSTARGITRLTFHGGAGGDTVTAGLGASTLRGEGGNDLLTGGGANDSLEGGGANDTLRGQGGDDEVWGGIGADSLDGGTGHDRLITGGGGDRRVLGGAGNDSLFGSVDAETMDGGADNDRLIGHEGHDRLLGGTGADTISGGEGDDTLMPGGGADSVDGEDGIDFLDLVRAGLPGNTSYVLNGPAGSDGARSSGIERFRYTGGTGAETVTGAENGDTLDGRGGTDRLEGLDGADSLQGGDDGDTLLGGAGADTLLGGNGADLLLTGTGEDGSVDGNAGNDTLRGDAGAEKLRGGTEDDRLEGLDGDDTLGGDAGTDILAGGAGADSLNGGEGFDTAEYAALVGERVTIRPGSSDPALGRWVVSGPAQAAGDRLAGVEAFRFGEGGDTITGTATAPGFDYHLDGRGGDDIIATGLGADTLIGGLGRDILRPGEGAFRVFGGAQGAGPGGWVDSLAQDDELEVDRRADPDGYRLEHFADEAQGPTGYFLSHLAFAGTDGSQARGIARLDYRGGAGGDTVRAGLGASTLDGAGGHDVLTGGGAADSVAGGEGNDTLGGAGGGDTLLGGAGRDNVDGGEGNDSISTGGGVDINVFGSGGNDTMLGSEDPETLNGGLGDDRLTALGGDDWLLALDGRDTILGGDGADTVFAQDGGDSVDGGEGTDILHLLRNGLPGDTTFYLLGITGSDGARAVNVEFLRYVGGTGAETVRGGANADTLEGSDGHDRLEGGEGNDALGGGQGNDTLVGGLGIDALGGGAGNDLISTGGGNDFNVLGQEGNDTILGNAGNEQLNGGVDHDSISGSGGDDQLLGAAGDDTLSGGAGNDTLQPDLGADRADGGDGIDLLQLFRNSMVAGVRYELNGAVGSDGARSSGIEMMLYQGGSGGDTVLGAAGNDSLSGFGGHDRLEGGGGGDALDGGEGNDTLLGGEGVDTLSGGAGNDLVVNGEGGGAQAAGDAGFDTLEGGSGADGLRGGLDGDLLRGLAGNDTLFGDAGADTLEGGAADDLLVGGAGADRFVFAPGAGTGRIDDFDADPADGQDLIDLRAFGFGSFAGLQAAGGTLTQQGGDARLALGAGNPVVLVTATQVASLTAADFLFA